MTIVIKYLLSVQAHNLEDLREEISREAKYFYMFLFMFLLSSECSKILSCILSILFRELPRVPHAVRVFLMTMSFL